MIIFLAMMKSPIVSAAGTALWITFCIGFFGVFAVFEFIANQQIRDPLQREWSLIFKVFAASICSSFHSMLSTLHILRNDKFYAKSVIYEKYAKAHGVRCCVSMILAITCRSMMAKHEIVDDDTEKLMLWMLVGFVLSLVLNLMTMYWIYEYVDVSKACYSISAVSSVDQAPLLSSNASVS